MRQSDLTYVQDCAHKIETLLKEYNCYLCLDGELDSLILIDKDTKSFQHIRWIRENEDKQ